MCMYVHYNNMYVRPLEYINKLTIYKNMYLRLCVIFSITGFSTD